MIREETALCGRRSLEAPYAELGEVEVNHFFCLVCLDTGIGTFLPGMGCDTRRSREIAETLERRKKGRGDLKQLRMAEEISIRTSTIDEKMGMIEDYMMQQSQVVGKETMSIR